MNKIIFKSTNKALTIHFKDISNFEETLLEFKNKLWDIAPMFPKKINVLLAGEDLNESQLEAVYATIEDSGLIIGFMGEQGFLEKPEKSTEILTSNSAIQQEIEKKPEEFKQNQNETLFYNGSLRSGQSIKFDGSVVIVGDVKAGSEVFATGNIMCMGSIKGLVHAGFKGNKECYVSALTLTPTQLRIADTITVVPKEQMDKNKNNPSYAYLSNGDIIITNLM